MQNLYDKISMKLVEALNQFLDGEIYIDELLEAQEREQLVYSCDKWEKMQREARSSIFQHTDKLFKEASECEKELRTIEKLAEQVEVECEKEALESHAFLLGRNRAPPPGFEHSNWYLGPYPALHLLEMLRDDLNDDKTTDNPPMS